MRGVAGLFDRQMEVRRRRRSVARTLAQLGTAGAVAFTARASFADHYRVPSGSMEPTVEVGDHIVVSKLAYGLRLPMTDRYLITFGAPARGDVVVLDPPEGSRPEPIDGVAPVLLKRVVAVEGDLVEVREGRVWIGGRAAVEPRVSLASGSGPDLGPVVVPRGKVLVLGDNRGNSRDGRVFGWIERSRVLGRAVAVVGRHGEAAYEPL